MKIIDYSPTDDNIFISCDDGILSVHNKLDIVDTNIGKDIDVHYVSFSHDSNHVLFISEMQNKLTVMSYNDLLIDIENIENTSFIFDTTGEIINFVVSPNKNQVAILFSVQDRFFDSVNGLTRILAENHKKRFVRVYDFTPGNSRLIFEKLFIYKDIEISLSEIDTIAISVNRSHVDFDDIFIYNLNNGDMLYSSELSYTIFSMKYFPECEQYHNTLLLIITDSDEKILMNIVNVDNFEIIFSRIIENIVYSFDISHNAQIAISTSDSGVIYFKTPTDDPIQLLSDKNTKHICFSATGSKLGVTSIGQIENSQIFYDITILNLNRLDDHEDNDDDDDSAWETDEDDDYEWETDDDDDSEWETDDDFEVLEIEIVDPQLDMVIPIQPTNDTKLQIHGADQCFDIMDTGNEIMIGNYLSNIPDNIVIFYKPQFNDKFYAVCLTFSALKKFLTEPTNVFYRCDGRKKLQSYSLEPYHYLKIFSHTQPIFVSYSDIKQKYMQRQNMIFLDYHERVEKTISLDASASENYFSSWHCQEGTSIDVFKIIF
jgi:hypothetical protein